MLLLSLCLPTMCTVFDKLTCSLPIKVEKFFYVRSIISEIPSLITVFKGLQIIILIKNFVFSNELIKVELPL